MSSFFGRVMILLLVVDLNRSFASIHYDNTENDDGASEPEHRVVSLEKKKFHCFSIMNIAPFRVGYVTKFQQFVAVLYYAWTSNQQGSLISLSHIRIYESRHPFSLLFVIYIGDIGRIDHSFDMAWNKKAESLFVFSLKKNVWQINWEDHLVRKFPCPLDSKPIAVSFSDDGHVLILDYYGFLYIYNINGTLIREIPCVQNIGYELHTPFGEYTFLSSRYNPRLNVWRPWWIYDKVQLHLSEMNDFNVESILDKNATNESNVTSTNRERLSVFFMSHSREKCNDFDIFKVTIERMSNITGDNLKAEYSASDERLFGEFLSNRRDRFFYILEGKGCFYQWVPEYPEWLAKRLMVFSVSYSHDSDNYLLLVVLSNSFIVPYVYIVELE